MARITPAFFTLVLSAIAIGCEAPPQAGSITIDRPEVFTRERLLNQRLKEQAWLEEQLRLPVDSTFQGYRDVREFSGLYAKAGASFDPIGGARAVAQGERGVRALERQGEIEALRDEMELARSKFELEQLRRQIQEDMVPARTGTPPTGSQASSVESDRVAQLERRIAELERQAPSRSAVFDDTTTAKLPRLPEGASAGTTRAELTSVEQFRDRLAYRNAVQAAMREQELDDTHDLNGFALYTLKFDITVLGAEGRSDAGLIELQLEETAPEVTPELFERWLAYLNQQVQIEAIRFQQLLDRDGLSDSDRLELALVLKGEQERLVYQVRELALSTPESIDTRLPFRDELLSDPEKFVIEKGLDKLRGAEPVVESARSLARAQRAIASDQRSLRPPERAAARKAVCEVLVNRYNAVLVEKGICELQAVTPIQVMSGGAVEEYYVPFVYVSGFDGGSNTEEQQHRSPMQSFKAHLTQVDAPNAPYVYTVEPKELAQNISDLAAKETLTNLVLSLNAALPQLAGANLSGYVDAMERSQRLLQGILRKPLVVGFASNTQSFGWLLGPRFEVGQGAQPNFSHVPVQHSVQATVAVPSWWPELGVARSCRWVSRCGGATEAHSSAFTKDALASKDKVPLPADLPAITQWIFRDDPVLGRRSPRIDRLDHHRFPVKVAAGRAESVVIVGRDLWRNPQVFLGHKRASSVEILPDMEGIVATFNLQSVPGADGASSLPLRVVTSEGQDFVEGFAELASPARAAPARSIALAQRVCATNASIAFGAVASALPEAFHSVRLVVREPTMGFEGVVKGAPSPALESRPQSLAWAKLELDPDPGASWWTEPAILVAAVQVKLTAADAWRDISVASDRFLHLPAAGAIQFEPLRDIVSLANADHLEEIGLRLSGRDRRLVEFGYPQLWEDLQSGRVAIRIKSGAEEVDFRLSPRSQPADGPWT